MAQRQDGIRKLLALLISRICRNVEVGPRLQPLDNKRFDLRTTTTSPMSRLDTFGATKDTVDLAKQEGMVYRILCKCRKVYIEETG